MSNRNKKSDAGFLMQGSILAIASLISRIVGLLYRVPLTATIGKVGNDYYSTAYEVYNIILLISSYSLPLAVSKLVSARMVEGHVRDAYKVLRCALIFAFISGLSAAMILYFGAEFFTGTVLETPNAAIALRVLAPTVFIVAILGVFRGFFQGLGSMIPSALSQIGEQIINAIVSIVAAHALFSYGKRVGGVLNDPANYAAAYGAAGGTLGTATGALFGLLFILFVYFIYRKRFRKMMRKDRSGSKEEAGEIFKVLILTIVPVLLSTTVYNISGIIDQGIFKNLINNQGYDKSLISEWWGVYGGQYKVLINVPISIASAMAASTVPALAAAFATKDKALIKKKINMADRFVMIVALPSMFGMMALASPIMQLLFNDSDKTSALMLIIGSCSIVFYSISTLSNGVLQGIDKLNIPVKNACIALVAHVGVLVVLLELFRLNIYSVIIANAFYALLMCILNGRAVVKYSGISIDFKMIFLIPGACSVIMGLIVYLSYMLFDKIFVLFTGARMANGLATFVSIIIGMIVYFVAMLLLKGVDEETLLKFPGGTRMVGIAYKLHLMR